MASIEDEAPLVTIVISFRERWRFTPLAVESILENSGGTFALWLLDPGMPAEIRDALEPHVEAGQLTLVEVREGLHPNEWRAAITPMLTSPYAVFIDNDVAVMPGWLERLVACAEDTGAGIVCPLYLWGERPESNLVHMAGGDLELVPTPAGLRMTESHRHVGRTVDEVPQDLRRRTCGFGEFHCLMMRRDVYCAEGMFDPAIVSVHEHIHASLLARELGFETWFEPDARVTYLAFAPWQVGELPALRRRWEFAVADRSLQGFASRWNVIDDEDYRSAIHSFLAIHAGHTDLLDPRPGLDARRGQMMTRADLQQTLAGLQLLALESGYDVRDLRLLIRGYRMATALMDGIYRPCGRPFINHLVGTASVLLFYGCPIPHVLAGLLHAAHTHGPKPQAGQWLDRFRELGTEAAGAVRLVDLYGERGPSLESLDLSATGTAGLPLDTASLFLLDAANDVDMCLSLEVAVTRRTDILTGTRLSNCETVLDAVGLPGLAATLRAVREQEARTLGLEFQRGLQASFRLNGLPPEPAPQATAAAG